MKNAPMQIVPASGRLVCTKFAICCDPTTTGMNGVTELLAATHAGMTTDEFRKTVEDWIATARHPRFDRPYTEPTVHFHQGQDDSFPEVCHDEGACSRPRLQA